jgi:hypothetical protein
MHLPNASCSISGAALCHARGRGLVLSGAAHRLVMARWTVFAQAVAAAAAAAAAGELQLLGAVSAVS